jgi:putative aldouronate transport system permease protein
MYMSHIKKGLLSRSFDVFNGLFMLCLSFSMIYPFYNQLILSISNGKDALMGGIYFFPRKFSTEAFDYVLSNSDILRGALISVLRVLVGTTTCLFCTGYLSYILTIKDFSGRKLIRLLFIITMYFSGGLIPYYILILGLKLSNTFTVYWLPGLIGVYYMLIMSSYMQELPESLSESARLDGCSEIVIFLRIILPVSKPVFAAVAVFIAVSHWNSWFDVVIFNGGGQWDTLQVYLRKIMLQVQQLEKLMYEQNSLARYRSITPLTMRAATTMLVTLPIVFVYPFLQKYFITGITLGAVKG